MLKHSLRNLILCVLFCLIGVGCMTMLTLPPNFKPIQEPSKPLEFYGFQVLPPQSNDWFIGYKGWYGTQLGKKPISTRRGPNTFIAGVKTTIANEIATKEELLRVVKKSLEEGLDPRFTVRESKMMVDESKTTLCVKFDQIAEDRGVPGYKGSVFIMDMHGLSCVHPDYKKLMFELMYSQRIPAGEQAYPLGKEGEAFLNSINECVLTLVEN